MVRSLRKLNLYRGCEGKNTQCYFIYYFSRKKVGLIPRESGS